MCVQGCTVWGMGPEVGGTGMKARTWGTAVCYNNAKRKEHQMNKRMTANAAELSEARRRASLSRRNRRGGRPKGWSRDATRPPSTIGIDPLDAEILRHYAALRGVTLRRVMHTLAAALVYGADIPARESLAPQGWRYADC